MKEGRDCYDQEKERPDLKPAETWESRKVSTLATSPIVFWVAEMKYRFLKDINWEVQEGRVF